MKKNLYIKQSFAFFLFVIMVLSSWIRLWEVYVYAADDSNGTSEAYYRIKVTSGASEEIRMLSLMVIDDHVYAEATELASIMGYTADKKEDTISITNRDNSELPFLYCFFYNGKKLVRRNFVTEQGEYEAPFECLINEEGAWIPFEYSVYLLNSSMLVLGDHIYIEKPHKKVIDIIYDEMSNRNYFFHQFYNSDYHKEMKTASDASRVVNVFDGILSFDLDSWLEYFQGFSGLSTAYDSKYGKEVALLICTMSKKESPSLSDDFASTSGSINTVSDLLSESTTEIREYLEKLNKNESLAEVNWIGTLSNKNNSIASADDAYNYLMLTQNKRDLRYLLGEDAALDVYDSLSVDAKGISFDATDYIKVVGGVLEGISYMTQFQNQDSFTVEALETILEDTNWRKWNLPNASVDGMKSTVEDLKSNVVKYSVFKYIRNNLLNTTKDVINLRELIGGPASAELVLWSILKNVVPFYSEGLSTTHNFELASYAYVFQCDTLALYMKKRDEVLNKDTIQSVTSEDLWPVIQYLYTYLKDAYVTREADIGSFNSDQQEDFERYIQELEAKNRNIINVLALLKKGKKDNQYFTTYGILPSENSKFLLELKDELIIDFIKENGMGIADPSIPADESSSQTYKIIPDEIFNMKASEAAEYLGLNIQNTVGHHALYEMFSRVKMPSHPRNSTNIMCSHGDEDKNGAWSLELYDNMFSLCGTYLGMPKAQAEKRLKQENWEVSEIQYSDYIPEEGDVIRNGEQYISYVPKNKSSFAYKNSGEIDIVVNLISNSVTYIAYTGGKEEKKEEGKEEIYDYVIKELQGLWYSNTMGTEGPRSKMVCEGDNFDGEIEDIVEYEEGYLVRINGGYSYYFGKSLDSCIFIDGWESTGDNSYGTSGWWKPNEEQRAQFGD